VKHSEFMILVIWVLGLSITVAGVGFGVWFNIFRGRPKGEIPGWNAVTKDCPYKGEEVGAALDSFVEGWEEAFGKQESDKIRKMLNKKGLLGVSKFSITFRRAEGRRYYDFRWNGRTTRIAGHMESKKSIVVAYLPEDPLGATAFFHELVHPSLLLLHGAADNNHATPPGPWSRDHDSLISYLKKKFKALSPPSVPSMDKSNQNNLPIPISSEERTVAVPIICGTCSQSS
jgi:hypothetical protein